jgi:hypothetical protein
MISASFNATVRLVMPCLGRLRYIVFRRPSGGIGQKVPRLWGRYVRRSRAGCGASPCRGCPALVCDAGRSAPVASSRDDVRPQDNDVPRARGEDVAGGRLSTIGSGATSTGRGSAGAEGDVAYILVRLTRAIDCMCEGHSQGVGRVVASLAMSLSRPCLMFSVHHQTGKDRSLLVVRQSI